MKTKVIKITVNDYSTATDGELSRTIDFIFDLMDKEDCLNPTPTGVKKALSVFLHLTLIFQELEKRCPEGMKEYVERVTLDGLLDSLDINPIKDEHNDE